MMSLFVPEIGIWEKVLRSVVVYLFVLLAFRFTGKRQVGQLTPFDLVVLLIISNVVQNAVIGPDNSLGGGLLGAMVILGLNSAVVELTFRSKRLRRLLEATPTLLIPTTARSCTGTSRRSGSRSTTSTPPSAAAGSSTPSTCGWRCSRRMAGSV